MAVDLTIYLDDRPGELARLGEGLGTAAVNIEGSMRSPRWPRPTSRWPPSRRSRSCRSTTGRARSGDASRRLGDAGVNVTLAYLATNTRLVFAADDLARAQGARR